MERIIAGQIKIMAPFSVHKVSDLNLKAKINTHASLCFCCEIDKEDGLKTVHQNSYGQLVQLIIKDRVVFLGLLESIKFYEENGACKLSVRAVSTTKKLDLKPQNHFFQNKKQTHEEMLSKSIKRDKGHLISSVKNKSISVPILQYSETAWEFALRVAANSSAVITPNITNKQPQVFLGIPKRKQISIDPIKIQKEIKPLLCKDNGSFQKNNAVSYFFEDSKLYQLGDYTTINGESYQVVELESSFQGDVLYNYYRMGKQEGFIHGQHLNDKQIGLSLPGEVIDVAGDQVKICLHISDDAEENKASWFDYAPLTNNGMYAMPPVNTTVALEWFSNKDGDIKANRTIRDGTELPNYEQRSLITEYEKQMCMVPHCVSFHSDSNNLSLSQGIRLSTEGKIKFIAHKDITMSGKKRLRIRTPEEVFITKPGSTNGILMAAREIHVLSQNTIISSQNNQTKVPQPYREAMIPTTLPVGVVAALEGAKPKE